jgi:hypothetical protein
MGMVKAKNVVRKKLKGRENLEDRDVDGRIEYLIWFTIENNGGFLLM